MAGTVGSPQTRRGRRAMSAEINVTPLVDVMLVLLIVFMITAPLLTTGVEVTLPKTQAQKLPAPSELPLSVTVDSAGKVYIQDTETPLEELTPRLIAITDAGYSERIFLRADEAVDWGTVAIVLAQLQQAGFQNVSLVFDPKANLGRTP